MGVVVVTLIRPNVTKPVPEWAVTGYGPPAASVAVAVTDAAPSSPIVAGLPVKIALSANTAGINVIWPPDTGSDGCYGCDSYAERQRKCSPDRRRLTIATANGNVEALAFECPDVVSTTLRN